MGKAARRRTARPLDPGARAQPAPFAGRPFEGLAGETEWVALRELLPAATASVSLLPGVAPDEAPRVATVATVLPLAWPALRRKDGEVLVAAQAGASSGDPSRDVAQALLLAAAADVGTPVLSVPTPTADTPRLQDVLDATTAFEVTVHEGFDFWVDDAELDAEGRSSLERANASVIPTRRVPGAPSVYWCVINGRRYVRWVLPMSEDLATDALARLHAADESRLAPDTRLLGAFRAAGLLVPVWEVPADREAGDFAEAVARLAPRLEEAAGAAGPLSAQERRARAGLVNRQVTLR